MTLLRLLRRPSPLLLLEDVAVGESGLRRKAPLGSPASIFSPLQLVCTPMTAPRSGSLGPLTWRSLTWRGNRSAKLMLGLRNSNGLHLLGGLFSS